MAGNAMIQGNFWENGPCPGKYYDFPESNQHVQDSAYTKTLTPVVVGTSVIGIKFNGGVVVAADKLGAYGSLARYRNVSRILKVNDCTALAGSGDIADFQYLEKLINQQVISDESMNDGFGYTPRSLFSWLTRVLYVRRTRLNPLWNTLVVAGMEKDKPFLGYVDKRGIGYEAPTIATGFGMHMAQPLLREVMASSASLSRDQAVQAVTRCMSILHYRDSRSIEKFDITVVTKDGVEIINNNKALTNWDLAYR